MLTPGDYGSYGINAWVESRDVVVSGGTSDPTWNWKTPDVKGAAYVPCFMDLPWIDCWPEENDDPPAYDNMYWGSGSDMGRVLQKSA